MAELSADDFGTFFEEIWEHPPFAWQQRLARQVLDDGRFPEVIDLPTGSGTTSVLDIAVFALAARPDVFARRIGFVIDRRVVVDQTSDRAELLRCRLIEPQGPITERVSGALTSLSSTGTPLEVSKLRGGIPLHHGWAQWPDQPAVVVSTVDQVGSRLLFRGYGMSPNMWPVHAGLVGNDCLLLLDEVHLSTAFAETADAILGHERTVRNLPRRGQLVEMSATPTRTEAVRFSLTDSDLSDQASELSRRVNASKRARLVEVGTANAPVERVFAKEIPRLVDELPDDAHVVGVIVNRVRTARDVASKLQNINTTVHLVTGRMRPLDRAGVIAAVKEAADPDRRADATDATGRTIVVATQTIEVGADLSFDAMITEVAPLDSLRQRFGRLDRRGTAAATGRPAEAVIVAASSTLRDSDDPVYGEALAATWTALSDEFDDGYFDVGAASDDLTRLADGLHAPRGYAPVMLDAHLDQFVQTSPQPWVQPAVEMYLHGVPQPGEDVRQTDVSVVWRVDVDPNEIDSAREALRLLRPRADEAMPVPLHAARAWLRDRSELPVADVPHRGIDDRTPSVAEGPVAVRWRGSNDIESVSSNMIGPGDTIVVPTSIGGISHHNWDPTASEPVDDFAHEAAAHLGPPAVRLDRSVLPGSFEAPPAMATDDDPDGEYFDDRVAEWWERQTLPAGWTFSGTPRPVRYGRSRAAVTMNAPQMEIGDFDGSDDSNSLTGAATTLAAHLNGVGGKAAEFARSLGLGDELVADLGLAGRAHDLGKVDRRFQLMLHGDHVAFAMSDEPVAKSRPGLRNRRRFGYPVGARHEFGSAMLLEAESDFLASAHDPDLVRHLVITHHGRARPLPLLADDPEPEKLEIEVFGHHFVAPSQVSSEVGGPAAAERFWRLIERYGTHGLAWLEAIFRLADHRRSQEEVEGTVDKT